MASIGDRADRTTKWIRWIARIWSVAILAITLVMVIGHLVVPDPNEVDYPPIENLLVLMMCLSVLGLGIAWRWEGWGGAISTGHCLTGQWVCIQLALRQQQGRRDVMTVLIGTSGFSYKDWVGPVYPEGLPKQEWLVRPKFMTLHARGSSHIHP